MKISPFWRCSHVAAANLRTQRFWDSPPGLQLASDVQDLLLGFSAGWLVEFVVFCWGARKVKRISIWKNFKMKDFGGARCCGIFFGFIFLGWKICISFFDGGDDNHWLEVIWFQNKRKSLALILPSLPANLVKTFGCFFSAGPAWSFYNQQNGL